MKHTYKLFFFVPLAFICCGQVANNTALVSRTIKAPEQKGLVYDKGSTIKTRFNTPLGFERIAVEENSFANYLRNLPLKPVESKVKYFDGRIKGDFAYEAVVDMEIGNTDLQQCADAVMRLRGEYFYAQKDFDKISFTLTNGFKVDYTEWMKGNRIIVNGNNTSWKKTAEPSDTSLFNKLCQKLNLIQHGRKKQRRIRLQEV